jgi:hypothetical protein
MRQSIFHKPGLLFIATILAGSSCIVTAADSAIPDPCTLITVAEMEKIVGPLDGAPTSPDRATGEISCGYTPKTGPSFVEIALHEGDLAFLRDSSSSKDAVSLPEFGKDAFLVPKEHELYASLYAKKGSLILVVSAPMGPDAEATVKAIAAKAFGRL